MIKEIDFKVTKKNEYLYNSVKIDINFDSIFKLNIEILKEIEYFHKILNNNNIKIINKIKKADWMILSNESRIECVSKKFKEVFEGKLKGYWYPTNNENYFIFLLNNYIDGLDLEKTKLINQEEKEYWYESIEDEIFKPEVEENEYLFSLPQEPMKKLATSKFEDLYRANNFKGIQFYKDINFKRKDGSRFDGMRFKKYDDEGNCLG